MKVRDKKYQKPSFLNSIDQKAYEKWLKRKAAAHFKRDKKSGNEHASGASYRMEIHRAVCASDGLDAYTGEALDWDLLSKYDNDLAQQEGREYKHRYSMLPTVDHVENRRSAAQFVICSWRTNDAKSDLSYEEFLELCRKILAYEPTVRARMSKT